MPKEYFFIYLIYGSAFIIMGIFAVQKKDVAVSNFPLVKLLKYLGFFGVTHGLSEWVTMVVIADLYPDSYVTLFILKQFLKSFSFLFLLYFGIRLLPLNNKFKKIIPQLPTIIFVFWLGIFTYYINLYGLDYHINNPTYNTIFLRYLMALPGGIITGTALILHARQMDKKKLKEIGRKYRSLAYIFILYGILDGVFVRPRDFFPASIINNDLFSGFFGFPIQIAKTMVGIGINYFLIGVIKTFSWEQKEKMNQLQRNRIVSEERRKLGMEVHDSIIQSLYGAGLKVEYLIKNKKNEKSEILLQEVKSDLNNTVAKTREFLVSASLKKIEFEDLKDNLQELAHEFNEKQDINIYLEYQMPSFTLWQLSTEKCTQVYYIVQEAISNVIKHSQATEAYISLKANHDFLYVQVMDNGVGISKDMFTKKNHIGIKSMQERAKGVGGALNIENIKVKGGTVVSFKVPWEVSDEEKTG